MYNGVKYLLLSTPLLCILSSCDNRMFLGWEKTFDKPVQISCIRETLKHVTPDLKEGSYVSNGAKGFPEGSTVTQFGYADPGGLGYFNLDVAQSANSSTRYYHSFEKLGSRPNKEYLHKVYDFLKANNDKISRACGLDFSEGDFSFG